MNIPKISIITPSFNQGEYIEDTIKSVINQEYPNLEYIIIDGGSTDQSVEVIKRYEKYLTYWVSEPDNGHGHALNKGFSRSTGDIMGWINSDDMYFPWTFKALAKAFSSYNDIQWVTGLQSHFNKDGILLRSNAVYKNIFDYLTGNYKWIQQESTFWHKGLWKKVGSYINESYKFMVDGELWSRFFLHQELWHLNIPLGGLRQHGERRAINNRYQVLNEMHRCIKLMKESISDDTNQTWLLIEEYKKILAEYESEGYYYFLTNNIQKKKVPQKLRLIEKFKEFKNLENYPEYKKINFNKDTLELTSENYL